MSKIHTLEHVKMWALKFGVECISDSYHGRRKKLKFRCGEGHEFERTLDSATYAKQWCSKCAKNISEELCRFILEKSFSVKFDKFRTKYDGRILELDGYNKELETAFEYNGKQHYQKTAIVRTDEALQDRFFLDALKVKYCEENGIRLLVIPHTVINDDMREYLLAEHGVPTDGVDVEGFICQYSHYKKRREAAEKLVGNRGKVISSGMNRLEIQCNCGHTWLTRIDILKKGHWCKSCHIKSTIGRKMPQRTTCDMTPYEKMVHELKQYKIVCLTNESQYTGASTTMNFQCSNGHDFSDSVWYMLERLRGKSDKGNRKICQQCLGTNAQKILNQLSSNGLSIVDVNTYKSRRQNENIEWMCMNGHKQMAKLAQVIGRMKRGTPLCSCLDRPIYVPSRCEKLAKRKCRTKV